MERYYRYLGGIFIAMLAAYVLMSFDSGVEGLDAGLTGFAAYEEENSRDVPATRPIQDVAKELEEMGFERTRPDRAYVDR